MKIKIVTRLTNGNQVTVEVGGSAKEFAVTGV
jgi:hypothetical protein